VLLILSRFSGLKRKKGGALEQMRLCLLETLPAGAFVFEFLGEIVTTKQMEQQNDEYRAKKTECFPDYDIALDVPSVLDDTVTDEDIIYIDATNCGNIARSVNHHCGDANLIHFNVHIERHSIPLYHISPPGKYLSMVSGLGTYMSGKRLCINKKYLFHIILTFCYLAFVVGGFFYK
jgi:hypothetical protein